MVSDMRISIALSVGVALCVTVQPISTRAQSSDPETSVSATDAVQLQPSNEYSRKNHFFVEFRARNAASYGHFYVQYGEANARHEVIKSYIAGFYPTGDTQQNPEGSFYYWSLGHIAPVPSEIGASDGDLEEQFVLARYRVWIDEAQYKRLVAYIERRKANNTPWHAFLANCVTFGRDVAVYIGLKVPGLFAISPSVILYPDTVVEMLRDSNGGAEKDPGPLRDAAGMLPAKLAAEYGPRRPSAGKKVAANEPKGSRVVWWQFVSKGPNGERQISPHFANEEECERALKAVVALLAQKFPDRFPLAGSCEPFL